MSNGPHSHHVVDVGHGTSAVEDAAQPVGVEAAAEQLDVARLAGQHVHQLERGPGSGPSGRRARRLNITVLARRLP